MKSSLSSSVLVRKSFYSRNCLFSRSTKMGERKGQNHYYPPDYDPKVGGLNKFLGTHALRERARKLHLGILIIRFEMPYNIWCEGCKNHIGMGVRYNAEKTKIGMYYTTPVYQFRMKCHLCDNHFEIKTDPGVSFSQHLFSLFHQNLLWKENVMFIFLLCHLHWKINVMVIFLELGLCYSHWCKTSRKPLGPHRKWSNCS